MVLLVAVVAVVAVVATLYFEMLLRIGGYVVLVLSTLATIKVGAKVRCNSLEIGAAQRLPAPRTQKNYI